KPRRAATLEEGKCKADYDDAAATTDIGAEREDARCSPELTFREHVRRDRIGSRRESCFPDASPDPANEHPDEGFRQTAACGEQAPHADASTQQPHAVRGVSKLPQGNAHHGIEE